MKLSIKEDKSLSDIEVSILCPKVDNRVHRIIEAVEIENMKLAGMSEGYLCVVGINEVLYAETVDSSTFLYTPDKVLESGLSLIELESYLESTEFIRATRQMLINLAHVKGLRPYLNARLELMLDNGERVIASRQFSPAIKKRIGL